MSPASKPARTLHSDSAGRIGLALGGGGARGLAHIPVLEAFDELGIKPSMITGTSIGALFGAAYASGLSAREISERAISTLSRPSEIARRLFSGRPRDWMELWSLRPFSAALMNPERLVAIVFPEAVAGDFASLGIPFKAVATDYREQTPVTLEDGPLGTAVAASIALPGIFRPVELGDRVLADGGLTNPLPYDQLGNACSLSLAIDVTGHLRLDETRPPTAIEAVLASSQIMQNAIVREKLKHRRPDILIRPPVDTFRILEFYKIKDILAAARPVKDEIKRELAGRLEKSL